MQSIGDCGMCAAGKVSESKVGGPAVIGYLMLTAADGGMVEGGQRFYDKLFNVCWRGAI